MVFFLNLFSPTVKKIVPGIDKNFEAEDQKFAKFSKLVEQFFQTVKGQNNI